MSYDNNIHSAHIPVRLQITSFFSGAATMILELAGSRLVAPFFGTSLIVWTALIGIIMTSLCIGNWLGGSLADRTPEGRLLGRILLFAAIIAALTAFGSNFVLMGLQGLGLNLYVSSIYAAVILFAPSSVLLGMVSPFTARLALQNVNSSGAVVGRLSALNSAGSILGTFLGGFVLISLLPSQVIIMIVACILAALSVIIYTGAWRKVIGLFVFGVIAAGSYYGFTHGFPDAPRGIQVDTAYNHLSIMQMTDTRNGRSVRVLITNPDAAQSLMYTDYPDELVSEYTQFYDLAFHYKPDAQKVLMLGGGGYCVPRYLLAHRQNVSVDVVELDPGVTQTARDYFNLKDDPDMRIFHEDARTFLNTAQSGQYDAVFMDTFNSWTSIPFQLTTVETGKLLRSILKPDGVLIVNIIASLYGPKSGVFHGIYKAFNQSFNTMMIFPVSAPDARYSHALQNIILVAMNTNATAIQPTPGSLTAQLLSHQWLDPFVPRPDVPAFTDQFAPVERFALMQN